MRWGHVLVVNLAFGLGMTRVVFAQTSIGFTHPDSTEALLSYRLPDWGYRTIKLRFGFSGNGEDVSGCAYCQEATSGSASQALNFQWYRESEQHTWSLYGNQTGSWNWNQTSQEPEDEISSNLRGSLSAAAYSRNYLSGNLFMLSSATANAGYEEQRAREGANHELLLTRDFRGTLSLGAGLGRMRDITPVLQAQRISERLQALERPPLSTEEVLRLASVLAQGGGYRLVFDRPSRRLWRDVLEPLIAAGETLSPFEVYYLGDVFYETLGSRQEGFLVSLSGTAQRITQNNENVYSYGATQWGPTLAMNWSHNLNLDHQLSASLIANYSWLDYDNGTEGLEGTTSAYFSHQWVLADRFLWTNFLDGFFDYNEVTALDAINRVKSAGLQSVFSFYIEDHITLAPRARVNWMRQEFGEAWREILNWHLEFSITYDLDNTLF